MPAPTAIRTGVCKISRIGTSKIGPPVPVKALAAGVGGRERAVYVLSSGRLFSPADTGFREDYLSEGG
ncbi:MAG: hypothetical protein M3N45_03755 [Actinomycetota bacterium]|nr:hypothetical protein [Actinomycetota bacterium]